MLLFAIWKRREINGGIFLPPAACIISSWISAHEGEKTDNVFTECLQCGKALLQWQQTNKNTHGHTRTHTETNPPRCIVCQTTSPWGDTGPHVLVTTASGWLSPGWGATRLHWSPKHTHTHMHTHAHTHTHTHTHTQIKSTFQHRGGELFFSPLCSKLLVYAETIFAVNHNKRQQNWTDLTAITGNVQSHN